MEGVICWMKGFVFFMEPEQNITHTLQYSQTVRPALTSSFRAVRFLIGSTLFGYYLPVEAGENVHLKYK